MKLVLLSALALLFNFSLAQGACTAPWGAYVSEGSMVTAYAASTPSFGGSCQSQTRVCQHSTLSGYYSSSSCQENSGCNGPFGRVANGQSIVAYASDMATGGTLCQSQVRTCSNGMLSGYYANSSCTQY